MATWSGYRIASIRIEGSIPGVENFSKLGVSGCLIRSKCFFFVNKYLFELRKMSS